MSDTDKTYPRKAWVLLPSFKPKEVEFVEEYRAWGGKTYGETSSAGKVYQQADIYESSADAIDGGHARLDKQQADLDKKLAALNKRRLELNKASANNR